MLSGLSGYAFSACLSRIPDPTFFHPGSRIRTVSIPDPGSSKNFSILTPKKAKKWFLSYKKYDAGCSSRIPDPDADFSHPGSRIPDPGVKRHPIPDPGSGSATLKDTFEMACNSLIQYGMPYCKDLQSEKSLKGLCHEMNIFYG